MLKQLIIIGFVVTLAAGCATDTATYDENVFQTLKVRGIAFKTRLETGMIRSGHSDWISTLDFSNGKNPVYTCGQNHRHEVNGSTWMFELRDQNNMLSNLNSVLKSNGVYDEQSPYELVLHLEQTSQGPDDKAIYTFNASVSVSREDEKVYSRDHKVVGNTVSEAFWSMDGWNGAKKRAANRLISEIIMDLDANTAEL